MASVRILIVDDSEIWRRAVCSLLHQQPDLLVVCESSDGSDAVQKSKEVQPDLILLDIALPNLNGLEAARQIRQVAPASRILFLTSCSDREVLNEALRIGALGFVVKSDAACDLLPAVSTIMRGEQFVGGG